MPESTGQRASAASHIPVLLLSAAFTVVVIASGKAHVAWWQVVRGRAPTPEAASLLAYRERLDVYAAWCKACLKDEFPSELLRDVRRRRWSSRATALAMTAWQTAFFIPHRLRLHLNTIPWICGLGMGLAVSLMPGSGLSNVWPWVAGASAAVAVLPDLQSLRWVYVKLLRPWMLAADEYFAAWVVVWPILLGGTAPHQGCRYRHRKRLLKAGHRNCVGLASGVRTIDTLLAAAASRETVYHKQWQQQCKIAALRERTSNAGFAALIVDGAHVIDVVVMQQDFAEGAAPDRAVCRTREEQPRILVVPAKELKMPFQVGARCLSQTR